MTLWSNNLNGIASGTAVTTANSGGVSGTAFTTVSGGAAVTAQAAAAFEGATGLQIAVASGSTGNTSVGWNATAAVGTRLSMSFWYRFVSLPTTVETIVVGAFNLLRLNAAGQIIGYNGAGGSMATSSAVTAGTWVFIQAAITPASTTTSGRLEYRVTNTAGGVLLSYDSGAAANAGTTAISSITFGHAGFTAAGTYYFDLLNVDNTLTSGFPGAAAPTAAGGNIKVYNGTAFVAKPVKVWTGTAWVVKPVKRWNGTAWVTTTY